MWAFFCMNKSEKSVKVTAETDKAKRLIIEKPQSVIIVDSIIIDICNLIKTLRIR